MRAYVGAGSSASSLLIDAPDFFLPNNGVFLFPEATSVRSFRLLKFVCFKGG